MRSWRSAALAAGLAACGADTAGDDQPPIDPDACATSHLDYATFGEPFLLDWCTGCHSAAVPADMRQMAPVEINFETLDGVRRFADRIALRAAGTAEVAPTMPPAGGPSAEERALLAEWIGCGAP